LLQRGEHFIGQVPDLKQDCSMRSQTCGEPERAARKIHTPPVDAITVLLSSAVSKTKPTSDFVVVVGDIHIVEDGVNISKNMPIAERRKEPVKSSLGRFFERR
jgi:hypothetical protein